MSRRVYYPASIHAMQANVAAYRDELRKVGLDHVVIQIPQGTAAYGMGYRFTSCPRAEAAEFVAGGAVVVDDAHPLHPPGRGAADADAVEADFWARHTPTGGEA